MASSHLYLVGMPGSGKSATGRELAKLLSCPFVDLDRMIELRANKKISAIFQEEGEDAFRDLESELLKVSASAPAAQVVATGGGVVLRESNRLLMRSSGKTVYLKTSLEELWGRVASAAHRPLIEAASDEERKLRLEKLSLERSPLYEESAIIVTTDGLSPREVALRIKERLEQS